MATIAGVLRAAPDAPIDPYALDGMRLAGLPGEPVESWTASGAALAVAGRCASNLPAAGAELKIVADARLDDRENLAGAVGRDTASTDAALLLAAYERWGIDCATHLVGEFAFAVWDPRRRSLYCARDPFGVKPLHYRVDRNGFAFASRLDVLSRPGDAPDRHRLAAYLAGIDDDPADTAIAGVRRLPMGSWLLWTPDALHFGRGATIEPDTLPPDEDYAAGFRERFLVAVDARSLDVPQLGAMLSGGLDSSSIVAAIGRSGAGEGAPLRTFSFAYPYSPAFDESDYAAAVIAQYPVTAHFIGMDDLAPLDGLADLAEGGGDLFFAPGLPKITRLLAQARRTGVRVMLDGHGGDEVVSFGYGRLGELAREHRWATLYRELRGVAAESGQRPGRLLLDAMLSQGRVGRMRARLRRGGAAQLDPLVLLEPAFARSTSTLERFAQWMERVRAATASPAMLHQWNVTSPAVSRGFETLRRAGDQVGVELRFPFYDQRLVRYALAIPEHEKFRNGWSRSVLRRAMAGILPDRVRWRRSKVDFGAELSAGLFRHHDELLHEVLRDGAAVGEYVDLGVARRMAGQLRAVPTASGSPELFALWRVVFLALWLANRSAAVSPSRVLS